MNFSCLISIKINVCWSKGVDHLIRHQLVSMDYKPCEMMNAQMEIMANDIKSNVFGLLGFTWPSSSHELMNWNIIILRRFFWIWTTAAYDTFRGLPFVIIFVHPPSFQHSGAEAVASLIYNSNNQTINNQLFLFMHRLNK